MNLKQITGGFLIVVAVLFSLNIEAKNIQTENIPSFVKTTKVDFTISINGESHQRSIEILDGRPAHLVTYNEDGTPFSKLTIHSSKEKKLSENDDLINLKFEYSEFVNNKWNLESNTSLLNRQHDEGTLSIEGNDETFEISAISYESEVSSQDIRVLTKPSCNFNQSLSIDKLNSISASADEACCKVKLSGGRYLKCCGALKCCNGSTCCTPKKPEI